MKAPAHSDAGQVPRMDTARSVVILTASVGGGHDGPARELRRNLLARGHQVRVVDLAELAPMRLGRLMRAVFRVQLLIAPALWGRAFRRLNRRDTVPGFVSAIAGLAARRVSRLLRGDADGFPADVVVGTFPAAGHVLAACRRFGTRTPLVTYITDPAVHRLWTVPGTQLYLTGWSTGPAEVAEHTDTRAVAVRPAVRPEFAHSVSMAVISVTDPGDPARLVPQLPDGPLALLSSGSWAVGQVRRTALDVLAHTDYIPVVLCGSNQRLRRRLSRLPGVVALGWVADMAALMTRVQVAVLNSGGLTLAEAVTCSLPVVHYRPLPGQGEANAATCETARIASWPRTAKDLAAAIAQAVANPTPTLPTADPAATIIAVADRHRRRPDAASVPAPVAA